jgi:exonuclease SbcC
MSVGGACTVDPTCFAGFAYVAFGHLHRPQTLGANGQIHYAGSLMKYSFSEAKGRYNLRRKAGSADGRSGAGLDLDVDDAHTGVARAVATLSGGESFLASLSLALGLADVVQGHSGGIHLQTMFIDEGFGSLDPEALDLAIRSLIDLQAGGRLVGIISHVPELRERIDARLEITTGKQGSRAQFVLA